MKNPISKKILHYLKIKKYSKRKYFLKKKKFFKKNFFLRYKERAKKVFNKHTLETLNLTNKIDKKAAILHFKQKNSNYYLTLTDLSYNTLFYTSAGNIFGKKIRKKELVSPNSMFLITKFLLFYLKLYEIELLALELKSPMTKHYFNVVNTINKKVDKDFE